MTDGFVETQTPITWISALCMQFNSIARLNAQSNINLIKCLTKQRFLNCLLETLLNLPQVSAKHRLFF
jgi:hypothetical protein